MKVRKIVALVLAVAMLITSVPASVMAVEAESSVVFTKELLPATSGLPRRVKLEAYATGSASASASTVPADIVLVLDQSGSMDESINNQTKLSIMKNAVSAFAADVASFNKENNDAYRLAIVGFASESGYNDNTELLTAYGSQTITNVEYVRVADVTTLDEDKTYYIQSGDEYRSIAYYTNPWLNLFNRGPSGWYTSGYLFVDEEINIQSTAIYDRVTTSTNVPSTTPGIAYNSITNDNYADAFINCTTSNIAATGTIGKAINQLDAEGATRTDLGMEMAEKIFENQPSGTYQNRKKIVVVITDGVPTTASDFSASVANDAISAAKSMKDEGTHIFSMYLGSPSTDSVNFLQALSSNYPQATSYTQNTMGSKAADSYYSAHTDSSAVTNVFHDIAFSITSNSTLDENSVVTDTISEYFRLPAVAGGVYDKEQISVFTVDKISATQWATEEKAFAPANVTIENDKDIKVTGFNFAYHCVTDTPKGGQNSTDYGRKLVIYIPIVEDEKADTFGGYLPTNKGAGIYQSANSQYPEITAENRYDNVTLKYNLNDEEYWRHIGTDTTYTFAYNKETLNGILSEMILSNYRPDGKRNLGVSMQYALVDTNLTESSVDDVVVATLSVPSGEAVDVTDFSKWTLGGVSEKVLTIPSGRNSAEAMYRLDCVLTNVNTSAQSPYDTLTESSYLDVEIVNENVHLVGGVIDDGGEITVEAAVSGGTLPGTIIGNTYREEVAEGDDTAKMIFTAKNGYEISKILHITSSNHDTPLDVETVLFDIENNVDDVTFEADGSYIFQAKDVRSGQAIEVYTRQKTYTLETSHDEGSIIMDGTTYTHSDTEVLEVFFRAHNGYAIESVTVNGTKYSAADILSNTTLFNFEPVTLNGVDYVVDGDVHLPRTRDHEVSVTSVKRTFNLTYKYYQQQDDGSFLELTSEMEEKTGVEFDAALNPAYLPSKLAGDSSKQGYTLRGWYNTYNGAEFTGFVDLENKKMPAENLTYYAFYEKNPDKTIEIENIKKVILNTQGEKAAYGEEKTFRFEAEFHERKIGVLELTLGATQEEKSGNLQVTLTGVEYAQFVAGEPIYVYEVKDSSDITLIYDDTRYKVYYGTTFEIKDMVTDNTVSEIKFENQLAPYLVNYDLAGGNIGGETVIHPKFVDYTEAGLLPAGVPIKDGYIFSGWKKDAVEVDNTKTYGELAGSKAITAITLVAQWTETINDIPGNLNGDDHFAYIIGYPDGTVRPGANITRAEVAAIFFRLLKSDVREENLARENNFADVEASHWHNVTISTMAKLGIVKGRAEDTFAPDAYITRGEFAAICARFDEATFEIVDTFTDVAGHWAESEIHEAAAHGWIKGYEDNTFKPDQLITRADAMTMINRVLKRIPEKEEDLLVDMIKWPDNNDKSAWYYLAVQEATNSHDYQMKDNIHEKWTALRENTDWTKYQ